MNSTLVQTANRLNRNHLVQVEHFVPGEWTLITIGSSLAITILLSTIVGSELVLAFYMFIHLALTGLVASSFFDSLIKKKVTGLLWPIAMVVLMHLIYFTFSAAKYLDVDPVYSQFALTPEQQLSGSVIGIAVVAGMVMMMNRRFSSYQRFFHSSRDVNIRISGTLLGILFILATLLKYRLWTLGYRASYGNSGYNLVSYRAYQDLFSLYLSSGVSIVLISMGGISLWQSRKNRIKGDGSVLFQKVFVILVIVVEIWWVLVFSGSRFALLLLVLYFLLGFQVVNKKLGMRLVQIMLMLLPVFAALGSDSVLILLGRGLSSQGFEARIGDIPYRTDLTDFAVAIARNTHAVATPRVALDAIVGGIPRVFLSQKSSYLSDSYIKFILGLGWPYRDYPDTLFSSGVMAMGRFGYILWPLAYVFLLDVLTLRLARWLNRWNLSLLFLLLLAITAAAYIELGWSELILSYRNLITLTIPLFLLLIVVRSSARSRLTDRSAHIGVRPQ